jgi:hypothetical protein
MKRILISRGMLLLVSSQVKSTEVAGLALLAGKSTQNQKVPHISNKAAPWKLGRMREGEGKCMDGLTTEVHLSSGRRD